MMHLVHPSRRLSRRSSRALKMQAFQRPRVEALEARCLLASGHLMPAAASVSPPVLAAQSDTGVSNSDGVTQNDGSAAAPLTFVVPNPTSGVYYRLYDISDASSPVLLAGPVLMLLGNSITVADQTLADGLHQIAYTTATSPGGTQSAFSQAFALRVETSLHVLSMSPATNYVTGSLPNNQVVVTFSGWLAGLVPDRANGSGFASNPFAVILVPSGPEGGGLYGNGASLWNAPYGVDGGDLPIPSTMVYHQNADGTSTITLTPNMGLNTDIYLISVSAGITDLAGNVLTNAQGNPGPQYSSFDLHASPTDTTPLAVMSVTAANGTTVINNDLIPQPDTIAIAFNKPLDLWTVNTSSIHLLAKSAPYGVSGVAAQVAYSPSTNTAYLTPEALLAPGTVYYVEVDTTVTDDQGLPAAGNALAQPFITSFEVSTPSAGAGQSPLRVTATNPANGTAWPSRLGYGAVTFSEPINLASLGRYSAMLIPQTGGVTTGGSGYADVPLNAKLAFNPNTNQLIIVPTTGLLPNKVVYLFALSGMSAVNGDTLGGTTVYSSFELAYPTPVVNVAMTRASTRAAETALPASTGATAAVPAPAPHLNPAPNHARRLARPAQAPDTAVVDRLLEQPGALFSKHSRALVSLR